ncbi:MAG TPA: aminotransferase class III-fold pyridoxal phosphate-dependent enzyme [Anaerolineales bacterium]|nr:aminotransferase class III-fold pyridoxal phosphate-dependent enzyme [Anaerolineales bacterium]HMR99855.1 aminotransferase class III-fold pyridoxal phosphate-dependent enzyme [Anaerolineales bacterium]HNQ93689.1 aminotransferase class III-fold pyridoxal phosphate-dependent enzyme [Anaerolineales bacterium]HNS60441.1 aminotransferase class III-fold pyridoxal phosphate-dependent enzyme [Anaerolineales bacterium]
MNYTNALTYSSQWLDIIKQENFPAQEQAKWIIEESKNNFAEHFNRGWLEYRKSVTEAGDWASVEWSGKGSTVTDVMGRKYIDWLGGFGMFDLGWKHPEVVAAVTAQLQRSPMPSQELIDPLRGVLAKLMAEITPGDLKYSWFAASGTEAIEASIKIAKLFTGKSAFIVALKAFHGKTMGSLSMMGKADYRQPLGMLYGGQVYHIPFGDADALEKQLEICANVGIGVAGVLLEPIQGEAGAIVPPDDFLPRVRAATKKHNVLLIADEVQTGLGRTGKLWGVNHWDVAPDIIATAKSLGGGVMPVSAVTTTEEIFKPMMYPNPFMHTTTTGGGALACSAAIAAIHITLRDRLWEGAATKGSYLIEKVTELAEEFPQLYKKVTGKGLLIGQHFNTPELGYKVAAELFKRGVLVAGTLTSAQTIRIEPPLIIEQNEIDEGLNRLRDAVGVVAKAM